MAFTTWLLIGLLATLLSGCQQWVGFEYVDQQTKTTSGGSAPNVSIEVTEGQAVGILLTETDQARVVGLAKPADAATIDDTSVATFVATTRDATAEDADAATKVSGPVFVLYGVKVGQTALHVIYDGEDRGSIDVFVVPQVEP